MKEMRTQELNKGQLAAVTSEHRRILTLAGAGTGKTKTMVTRVARLIEEGHDPVNMAILTFTRAAAGEMKERLAKLVGDEAEKVYAGTFHSFAVHTIRKYGHALGYSPAFSIYDSEDTLSIIEAIIEELQYKTEPKKVIEAIDKNTIYNIPIPNDMKTIVSEYNFRCKRQNSIDLGYLIPTLKRLLEDDTIKHILHTQYKYVFVDEFQDTDPRQMELLNAIDPDNLFIVGDDFQSLYGFRGADVSIIMGLAKDPEWQTIKLEENYRSTSQIVDTANNLIKNNNQTEKILKAHRNGMVTQVVELDTPEEELEWIADKCLRLGEVQEGYKVAVLARTNKQVQAIADKLETRGVPYQIPSKETDILRSTTARNLFMWMQSAINVQDDEAVQRSINWPYNEISRTDMLKIEMFQLEQGCSFMAALEALERGEIFRGAIAQIREAMKEGLTASETFDRVVAYSGVVEYHADKGLNNRNQTIEDIHGFIRDWETMRMDSGDTITPEDWMEFYKMRDIEPSKVNTEENAVQVMTIHGSKGLEFDNVIICGLNEKSLPLNRADIKEERRIMYVAMTRAKNRLWMTRSRLRATWNGKLEETEPSRFLTEINRDLTEF